MSFGADASVLAPLEDLGLESKLERLEDDLDFLSAFFSEFASFFMGDLTGDLDMSLMGRKYLNEADLLIGKPFPNDSCLSRLPPGNFRVDERELVLLPLASFN